MAILSSVLNSDRSIAVNIAIMRAFVRLREIASKNKELAQKIREMEKKYDAQFKKVFQAIYQLMEPALEPATRLSIGFTADHSERL